MSFCEFDSLCLKTLLLAQGIHHCPAQSVGTYQVAPHKLSKSTSRQSAHPVPRIAIDRQPASRAAKHRDRCNKTDRSQPSWRGCWTHPSSPMKMPFPLLPMVDKSSTHNTRSIAPQVWQSNSLIMVAFHLIHRLDAQRRQYLWRCQVAAICERLCSLSPRLPDAPAPTPAVILLVSLAVAGVPIVPLALIFDSSGAPLISVALLQPFIVSCARHRGMTRGETWGQAATAPVTLLL